MATITDPIIGRWYKDVENNLTFKVVATAENGDLIEVQYQDGDIGEDRKSVVQGKSVDLGGRRNIKQKKKKKK